MIEMIKITKRSEFPKCVQKFKELKGICIGGCVDKGFSMLDRHVAHAHCWHQKNQGWICLRYKYQLRQKQTMLHEVAHLIANKSSRTPFHGKKWKATLCEIGGSYKEYSYALSHNRREISLDYTYRSNML